MLRVRIALDVVAALFVPLVAPRSGPRRAAKKISTGEQRKAVSITVYNQNFGLVREIRELDVGHGQRVASSSAT